MQGGHGNGFKTDTRDYVLAESNQSCAHYHRYRGRQQVLTQCQELCTETELHEVTKAQDVAVVAQLMSRSFDLCRHTILPPVRLELLSMVLFLPLWSHVARGSTLR